MSELTDTVRRMLSQAQVFARDTPFEAVSRARQATLLVDEALASASPEEWPALEALRKITLTRADKYKSVLDGWNAKIRARAGEYNATERERIGQPLRIRDEH
ncbi:MAG: hypothetical protein JWN48_2893 [Myxococcaceae bacterium]|nr:hypothetical protein [Myxococcaceae bacterium]